MSEGTDSSDGESPRTHRRNDEESIESSRDPERTSAGGGANEQRRVLRPRVGLIAALVALCGLLAFEVIFIVRGAAPDRAHVAATAVLPRMEPDAGLSLSKIAISPSLAAAGDPQSAPAAEFAEEGVDDQPRRTRPKHFATVQEAAVGSCTTSSVDGLSRQIIEQVRCTDPTAFVPIPPRPNLVLEANVFPYLELSARDHLLKALDQNRDKTLTVHSALRTVAQQYLVWRWSANKRCGVRMATTPGDSNHETGRALDIASHAQWRSALESQDFRWLGPSDAVHFDFRSSRSSGRAPDILAFQRLSNRNHPDDRITESGQYDGATEQRLRKAPPSGFRLGATCSKARGASSNAKGAKRSSR